jgi:hypothetical protein
MSYHLFSYNYNTLLNVQQQDQDGYPNQIQSLPQSWAWKATIGKDSSKVWR